MKGCKSLNEKDQGMQTEQLAEMSGSKWVGQMIMNEWKSEWERVKVK